MNWLNFFSSIEWKPVNIDWWKPGNRILRLPKIIQPLAIAYKNFKIYLIYLQKEVGAVRHHLSPIRREVYKKLAFGVEYVYGADVEGDIAEFGTMTGTSATVIAWAIAKSDAKYPGYQPKRLHLFDSFQGLPKSSSIADIESPHVKRQVWAPGQCKGGNKKKLQDRCLRFLPIERINIYDGWFKDTLCQIPENVTFAMLHIDCDLYQSTIEVLDYCFSHRLIKTGTAIFFDDWSCNRASPEFGERKAWDEAVEKFSIKYSDCGEYGIFGRKFLVHQYQSIEV